MFFYFPKLTVFLRKLATIQCAPWDVFFFNARPKSNARAHLKERKNIVAYVSRLKMQLKETLPGYYTVMIRI